MRNFQIGSVTGIPVRLNFTLLVFLPVLAWLVSRPDQMAQYASLVGVISPHPVDVAGLQTGYTAELVGIAAAVGLFVGVLLHELGHSWTARRYGITIPPSRCGSSAASRAWRTSRRTGTSSSTLRWPARR